MKTESISRNLITEYVILLRKSLNMKSFEYEWFHESYFMEASVEKDYQKKPFHLT